MKSQRLHIALIAVAISISAFAQKSASDWKDQGEYDIGSAAQTEKDPVKQLDLLKKWEQQYPESAFRNNRTLLTTNALLNIVTGALGKTDKPSVETGRKAAEELIRHFSVYFDPAVRPEAVSSEQWASIREVAELQAHGLLAQIAAANKDDAAAEAEYRKILTIDPTQAATSYRLGAILIHEMAVSKDYTRFPEALYELARSLAVTGQNALPPAGGEAAEKSLRANFGNYHGSPDGLDDLIKQAASSAFPPEGFQLLSSQQIFAQKQQEHSEWALQHPDLDFWQTIKTLLEQQGDEYFSASLKGVGLPPASASYKGPEMFTGTVVSVLSSKQILVNVDNPVGDAVLKFDNNIRGEIPAGMTVHFKGMVDSYTKSPSYTLTLEILVPKTDVTGLPEGVTFVPEKAVRKPTH